VPRIAASLPLTPALDTRAHVGARLFDGGLDLREGHVLQRLEGEHDGQNQHMRGPRLKQPSD